MQNSDSVASDSIPLVNKIFDISLKNMSSPKNYLYTETQTFSYKFYNQFRIFHFHIFYWMLKWKSINELNALKVVKFINFKTNVNSQIKYYKLS